MMKSEEIRSKFLEFFKQKGHQIVPSDSLVPKNDPSVLFTSAGMNQFKEQFMGKITDFTRAASCQKCLRTADLINVGKSPSHHTFFEMLGNFSFGDYFKPEAIAWAWEFVTEVLKLPREKLWISVHEQDETTYKIWVENIKIDTNKIIKLSDIDNFWPANAPKNGPNGPCGPCSEIFFDWGSEFGCKRADCSPVCDCKRFTEIWNLVFTQYDRQSDGSLQPLPSKNIDTGMGLERITAVMQRVRNNYETDLFVPILNCLFELLNKENLSLNKNWREVQAKAIVDHLRAATFAIADGIIPSNEARGYVIRKLIRRSIVNLKKIGVKEPLCFKLVFSIGQVMGNTYPEVKNRHATIAGIIKKEEEMFWSVLNERSEQVEQEAKILSEKTKTMTRVIADVTTANAVFTQFDTYGVPIEISKEIYAKHGLIVSDELIEKEIDKQRERSRSSSQISNEIFVKGIAHQLVGIKSEFLGYETLETEGTVLAIIKNNSVVDEAKAPEQADVVLDKTTCYPESGGQAGDQGILQTADGFKAEIINTIKIDNAIVHKLKIETGSLKKKNKLAVRVTSQARIATARNHTATHLLQYVLRKVLGETVEQSGSDVSPERLRFDFTYFKALKKETLREIETTVNHLIWENIAVSTKIMDIEEAKKTPALAFFGEKYAQVVRVVCVGDYSQEFCGGTHVKNTGQIGLFKIVSEASVAQGIRRIEAITNESAVNLIYGQEELIENLCQKLKTKPEILVASIDKVLEQSKQMEKDLKKIKMGSFVQVADELIKNTRIINNINVLMAKLQDYDLNSLRGISDIIRNKKDPVVFVLTSLTSEKALLLVGISKSLVQKGLDSVKIIKELTDEIGVSGGGKKELAQAGCKNPKDMEKIYKQAKSKVEKIIQTLR
ncbi:MAG: alanine--tRNA ligase [Candidatus Omnitrophota bacterium]